MGRRRTGWFPLSGLLALVAFMSQVGPDEAVSNLSKWYGKISTPPDWIQRPELDAIWTIAFLSLAILSLIAYFIPPGRPIRVFGRRSRPAPAPVSEKPKPETVQLAPETRKALGIDPSPQHLAAAIRDSQQQAKRPNSKYALPKEAEQLDITTATNKELGKLIVAVANEIGEAITFNHGRRNEVELFNSKYAALFFWLYEEARNRGHRVSALDLYYERPEQIQNVGHLSSEFCKLGSRLPLYQDS